MRLSHFPLLHTVLEDERNAAVVVNESGTIVLANAQAGDLLGYAPGELEGQSVESLLPERFRIPHIGYRLRFTDDRRTRPMGKGHGLIARCKDGSERPVAISLSPVQHGLETLVVAIILDTTNRSQP